jgi:hypothetical protein
MTRDSIDLSPPIMESTFGSFVRACSFGSSFFWVEPIRRSPAPRATLAYAREVGHAFSLAFAMFSAAWIEHFRGRWQVQQELAHSADMLAAENGFAEQSCFARGMEGHALFAQGQRDEGIAEMAEALREERRLGALSNLTNISAPLIDAYTKVGQTEDAQELLAEAVSNAQPWTKPNC